jgi:hypothetical protein|tara:strand:- start:276 stop:461 length:186 start_codon:yes stop_codon:yes gene_type:complete
MWYNILTTETNMDDTEYPITLSYTKPNGEKVSVEILNDEQAEDEYHTMWWFCGQDVKFSVD